MKRLSTISLILILGSATAISIFADQPGSNKRSVVRPALAASPFTIDDFLKVRRVGDPQVSPDGRWIAYTIADTDKAANKRRSHIYLLNLSGGEPQQLMPGDQSDTSPRWRPDGKQLAFVSSRANGSEIWTVDVADGQLRSEPKKITDTAEGADGPVWSPDGKWIAFTADVYPACSDPECDRKQAEEHSKVKAHIADHLLYRHWTEWKDGKRKHILMVSSDGGPYRDLTPGDHDAPPFSLGGMDDYAFSPDSRELAYASNIDQVEAISTNTDIFVVSITGAERHRLTGDNPAADLSPRYSPDGRYIAYRAQARPGFESDQWRLMLYDRKTGQTHSLSSQVDAWVDEFTFSPTGEKIYFIDEERGRHPIYEVPVAGGAPRKLVQDSVNGDVAPTPDGKGLVFTRQSLNRPVEIYRAASDGSSVVQLTKTNDAFLAGFGLRPAEDLVWEGAAGARVHGFLIKPPNFTPTRNWPMVVFIHGGPQGAWSDAWSYRWNPELVAAAGYVVFCPNPRGSTGYGQRFVDEVSADWGGKVYTDIMNGVAYASSQGFIDRDRIGAAGGSFGGYMIDWIEGHNEDPRFRFKALVSHSGVYNLTSAYGATEELWFPEWEFKGTPWTNPEMYAKWSPHMFVRNFKTPMLVIHGEKDYRVPVTDSFQLFTALQRQGVESKLLEFPDEGHWVLKPLNSELWYKTVLSWFDAHLKPKKDGE